MTSQVNSTKKLYISISFSAVYPIIKGRDLDKKRGKKRQNTG
jgi:hypothetical protein